MQWEIRFSRTADTQSAKSIHRTSDTSSSCSTKALLLAVKPECIHIADLVIAEHAAVEFPFKPEPALSTINQFIAVHVHTQFFLQLPHRGRNIITPAGI